MGIQRVRETTEAMQRTKELSFIFLRHGSTELMLCSRGYDLQNRSGSTGILGPSASKQKRTLLPSLTQRNSLSLWLGSRARLSFPQAASPSAKWHCSQTLGVLEVAPAALEGGRLDPRMPGLLSTRTLKSCPWTHPIPHVRGLCSTRDPVEGWAPAASTGPSCRPNLDHASVLLRTCPSPPLANKLLSWEPILLISFY